MCNFLTLNCGVIIIGGKFGLEGGRAVDCLKTVVLRPKR